MADSAKVASRPSQPLRRSRLATTAGLEYWKLGTRPEGMGLSAAELTRRILGFIISVKCFFAKLYYEERMRYLPLNPSFDYSIIPLLHSGDPLAGIERSKREELLSKANL